jgi:hypothetical protein
MHEKSCSQMNNASMRHIDFKNTLKLFVRKNIYI